jgi:hypothetical protein
MIRALGSGPSKSDKPKSRGTDRRASQDRNVGVAQRGAFAPSLNHAAWKVATAFCVDVTSRTMPLRYCRGTRLIATRRFPAQARWRESPHVPIGAADRLRGPDLRCCQSSLAISRPAPVRRLLARQTAVSRLVHRTRGSSRGRTRTGRDHQVESRRESRKQRSGSAVRVPPFLRWLSRPRAAKYRFQAHRNRALPSKWHSYRYPRRSQAPNWA